MSRVGILVTSRKPRSERVPLPDGTTHDVPAQREKKTDLRIGLDMVRMARNDALDVAVIFSQDQDLAELAQEVHTNRIDLQCQISTKTRLLLYPDIKPKPGGEQLQPNKISSFFMEFCPFPD